MGQPVHRHPRIHPVRLRDEAAGRADCRGPVHERGGLQRLAHPAAGHGHGVLRRPWHAAAGRDLRARSGPDLARLLGVPLVKTVHPRKVHGMNRMAAGLTALISLAGVALAVPAASAAQASAARADSPRAYTAHADTTQAGGALPAVWPTPQQVTQ